MLRVMAVRSVGWQEALATISVSSGKWYAEFQTVGNYLRMGVAASK